MTSARLRRFAGLLPAALLLSCATDPVLEDEAGPLRPPPEVPDLEIEVADPFAPEADAEPLLFRAEGPEGSFFLFGSIHVGDERTGELGPEVEAAYEQSDEVVMEIDLRDLDPAAVQDVMLRFGFLEPPDTLESVVSPETWKLVEEAMARSGQPVERIQHIQPWLLGFTLASDVFAAAGLRAEQGVDQRLTDRALGGDATSDAPLSGGKPIVGLETLESQFRMLSSLPASVQERMLRDALDPDADDVFDPSALVEAWRRGDEEELSVLLEPEDPEMALFYEHVIYRRNEEMARRLDVLAADGKQRFVVVGVLHLIGERGIPALLAERGYRVSRSE